MPKYRVTMLANVSLTAVIEAEDEETAVDIALDDYLQMQNYVGNGGMDRMLGPVEHGVTIEPGEALEASDVAQLDDNDPAAPVNK